MNRLISLVALSLSFAVTACTVPQETTRANSPDLTLAMDLAKRNTSDSITNLHAAVSQREPAVIPASPARKVRVINRDNGGNLVQYAKRVSRDRIEKKHLVFNGVCASACTLYLSLEPKQMCITRKTSFLFHRAYGAKRDVNQWGTNYLYKQYPAWVKNWIDARGGLTNRLIRMNHAYASKFIQPCKSSRTNRRSAGT